MAIKDLPHVVVVADHREHRAEVSSGRLQGEVSFDVVDGDAGVDETWKVFESRVLVDVVRALKIADLVGEQLFGQDVELFPRVF